MSSSTSATINGYFQSIQFRDAPAATLSSYVALVGSGAMTLEQVRTAIIDDPYTTNNVDPVIRLYQAAFGRVPEAASSIDFYADRLADGRMTPVTIAQSFAASPEFQLRYGTDTAPNAATITALYLNVLGRAPEAAGLQFYLNSGMSTAQMLQAFSQSPEFQARSNAAVEALLNANALGTAVFTGPLQIVTAGQTFTLTTGVDPISTMTGTAGNDTFVASKSDGTLTLTSLDALDGGAGNDTLTIAATAAVDTGTAVGATVRNIENASITSTGAVTANTTGWTGLTSLSTASTGNSTLTAATTTDITASVASPTGAGAAAINGGRNVTLAVTDTATTKDASTNTIVIGGTTAPTGAVTVTQTESVTDAADAAIATGTITVTGGTTVTVNSLATVGAGSNAADKVTIGKIEVTGNASTTSVSVTQSAATVDWASAGNLIAVRNGDVTIADGNAATASDTITSVSLAEFGNATITSSVLSNLTLNGGATAALASGTVAINQSAADKSTAATTLNLNLDSGFIGAISGTQAAKYTTVNVATSANSTVADLTVAAATALNFSGAGVATLTANTGIGAVTAINSTGGGVTLGTELGTAVAFTGGDGKETIALGATTKAITTGGGDDSVTINVTALGTGGSVNAGLGTDTLVMSAANAITASAGTTFETKIDGFERLSLGAAAADGTVNLANLDDINHVTVAGVDNGKVLTLSNATSGHTLVANAGAAGTIIATLANNGTTDVVNVSVSDAAAKTINALTVDGFETIAFATDDSATTPTGKSHIVTTLTATDATTITVTGDAGLTLTTFNGTKLTTFDASGVTKGAVSYTTGALAGASSLSGGAGGDTINAAAAVATVVLNGNGGDDTLTGSNTKSSTINGGDGNDGLTGGAAADVIDGGAGTDTYTVLSANVAEQAGSSTTVGMVVNLSADALTQSAVFTATGTFLTAAAPSVAANTSTYLFNGESTTNASIVDTLVSIENVTGSNGTDYIVGSAGANALAGGAGADTISGGDGNDILTGGVGVDSLTGGAGSDNFVFDGTPSNDTGITLATADVITDFVSGTDTISGMGVAGNAAGEYTEAAAVADFATALAAANAAFNTTNTQSYYLTSITGGPGLLFINDNNDATAEAVIVLTGITSANFAATDILA